MVVYLSDLFCLWKRKMYSTWTYYVIWQQGPYHWTYSGDRVSTKWPRGGKGSPVLAINAVAEALSEAWQHDPVMFYLPVCSFTKDCIRHTVQPKMPHAQPICIVPRTSQIYRFTFNIVEPVYVNELVAMGRRYCFSRHRLRNLPEVSMSPSPLPLPLGQTRFWRDWR